MSRRAIRVLSVFSAFVAVVGLAPALAAQVTVIDEGTFTLTVDGARIGREDFSIRAARGAAGAAFVAQGTVLSGERRTAVAVNIDSLGRPLRFQVETREGTAVVESYIGTRDRGVWTGRALRADGESARESRLPDAAIALEPGIVHHLWLVLRFGRGGPATIVSPRTLQQMAVRLEEAGADSVTIGPRTLPATRWIVRGTGGSQPLWELWTDSQGRMLRVVDATRGVDAVRDEPPRA